MIQIVCKQCGNKIPLVGTQSRFYCFPCERTLLYRPIGRHFGSREEIRKRIRELYGKGLNFTEISRILQCSKSTVGYHLPEGERYRRVRPYCRLPTVVS